MSPEVYAWERAARQYKLAELSPQDLALLKRHIGMPAYMGGMLGAGLGLYHGVKDVVKGEEGEDSPLFHPIKSTIQGGLRGAGVGIGANAAMQLIKFIADAAGLKLIPSLDWSKAKREPGGSPGGAMRPPPTP